MNYVCVCIFFQIEKVFEKKILEHLKFKIKYFCVYMTSLKYSYLEYILLLIICTQSHYCDGALVCDKLKLLILKATTLWPLLTMYNIVDPAFYSAWSAVWLLWVCMFIHWSEMTSACTETTWQREARLHCD